MNPSGAVLLGFLGGLALGAGGLYVAYRGMRPHAIRAAHDAVVRQLPIRYENAPLIHGIAVAVADIVVDELQRNLP